MIRQIGADISDQAVGAHKAEQFAHIPEVLRAARVELQHDQVLGCDNGRSVGQPLGALHRTRLPGVFAQDDVHRTLEWRLRANDPSEGIVLVASPNVDVYRRVRIASDEPPPPPPPSPEELELQREMDDLTNADYMFRDDGE